MVQDSDSFLFQLASRRIVDEIERIPVTPAAPAQSLQLFFGLCVLRRAAVIRLIRLLADVVHIHNEIGIKNERLFRARI